MQTVFIKFSTQDARTAFTNSPPRPVSAAFRTRYTRCPSTLLSCWMISTLPIVVPPMTRSRRPMIRFEILFPLFYNDGRPIEPERFLETEPLVGSLTSRHSYRLRVVLH